MQKSVSLHEFLNTWNKIEDISPLWHVRFIFSPLFSVSFPASSLFTTSVCFHVTVSLFTPSFYTFIKDGCRADKHNRFYKKKCWTELHQNLNVYCLYMFVHHFFLHVFTRVHEGCFCDGDCNWCLKEEFVFGHHSSFCHFITTSSCWTFVWGTRFGLNSHS